MEIIVPYRKFTVLLTVIYLTGLMSGCDRTPTVQKLAGHAQGTTYHISFWQSRPIDAEALNQAIQAEFARIDQQLSNYRPDSVIEQFNANASTQVQAVGNEITQLVDLARIVGIASQGCYDLTVKPLFELWGFSQDSFTPPTDAAIKASLALVGLNQVETVNANQLRKTKPQVRVDLSSVGQGYSVGRISSILEQQGIKDYLVEVGGELQTRGRKPNGQPWRIALEKPLPGERTLHKVITIKRTEPLAVMTSGTYRHYFDKDGKRYSHILDARTGKPITHSTVSVSVLHQDPTQADAWSTALLCLGKTDGLAAANQTGIAALFIEQDNAAFNEFASDSLKSLLQRGEVAGL
jgi:FAD:protein FMN transferase